VPKGGEVEIEAAALVATAASVAQAGRDPLLNKIMEKGLISRQNESSVFAALPTRQFKSKFASHVNLAVLVVEADL